MRNKFLRFFSNNAEKIGVLLGLSIILSLIFLDGIILTILGFLYFIIIGAIIILAYLQSKGWKYKMETNAEQRSLNIEIPYFNLYNLIY
jgi:hypothetical protein